MNEEINQNGGTDEQGGEQFPIQETRSMGMVFGSIIVVILLIVVAFYFWGNRENGTETLPPDNTLAGEVSEGTETEVTKILEEEDLQIQALEDQGATDEIDEIMEDLEATDLEDLTGELDQIEGELGL